MLALGSFGNLKQYVEEYDQVTQMRFQMSFAAMKKLLERADVGQKREDRFDDAALIPGALHAQLEIVRHAVLAAKAEATERDRLAYVTFNERQKTVVAFVGRRPLPIDDAPVLIDDPAHFDADDPAPIALAFLADLLRGAAFAHGVNQFDAVTVGDGKEDRRTQETIRPGTSRREQALQTLTTWQAREQVRELTFEPAVKVAEAAALERKQRAQRDNFTRIKLALRMLGNVLHPVINRTKKMGNNVFSLQENLRENGFRRHLSPAGNS